jgi:hypothetical protein
MDKKKITFVWSVFEDEGYWYYMFGNKEGTLVRSPKIMTKYSAEKALANEIAKAKRQYPEDKWEVTTEEFAMK